MLCNSFVLKLWDLVRYCEGPGALSVLMTIHSKKMSNLFWPDENSIEQCCAVHIVPCCQQY